MRQYSTNWAALADSLPAVDSGNFALLTLLQHSIPSHISGIHRGTVVSIVYTVDAHAYTVALKQVMGKITRHYSRYCTVAFCFVHKCELSYMCPGHDIELHPHRVKLYRIGCGGSGLVLAKALT